MKLILTLSQLFIISISISAQSINNGLYIGKERNEFVIIRNDTVKFRCYNDDALAT